MFWFRSIINAYKDFNFEGYLGTDSDIVHDKQLETVVLKIQSNKEDTLTDLEKGAAEKLLRPSLSLQDTTADESSCDHDATHCPLLSGHSSGNVCKTRLKAANT